MDQTMKHREGDYRMLWNGKLIIVDKPDHNIGIVKEYVDDCEFKNILYVHMPSNTIIHAWCISSMLLKLVDNTYLYDVFAHSP